MVFLRGARRRPEDQTEPRTPANASLLVCIASYGGGWPLPEDHLSLAVVGRLQSLVWSEYVVIYTSVQHNRVPNNECMGDVDFLTCVNVGPTENSGEFNWLTTVPIIERLGRMVLQPFDLQWTVQISLRM